VGGEWLIRIEDVDTTREIPGSADRIVEALRLLGFQWTEPVVRQSTRTTLYATALKKLIAAGEAYLCSCSRTEIQSAQTTDSDADEMRYPGWCRDGVRHAGRQLAVRLRVPFESVCFEDRIQGRTCHDVSREVGDFVIRRRDGLFAYQLAVAIDDASQDITHVVRGADLLSSTPRQRVLQQLLGLPHPVYAHLPVATDRNGIKLAKSSGAAGLDLNRPGHEIWRALKFLRQHPPEELRASALSEIWNWAIEHWDITPLHGVRSQPAED
jgi:glutamyl-Q tRNA(Asp) synthetase